MNRKDLIYNKLLEYSSGEGIDAQTLANALNLTRANVSHDLNLLYKEGKVNKTTGRPVLFFVSEVQENKVQSSKLDELTKSNISLKHAVEQLKAAILYPPKGMNCLIYGETGVGKSMFASLMHEYAVEMGVKSSDSPFLTFNCADYTNNPQLLTSQLFGVKKGTYTGAESDKVGLIEKADGGILFLDEVHRLPPEGQEALFIFLDTGFFRRMGDYETRKSHVLIISATTENPDSSLLHTFTRRIPMLITLPSLKERTLEERLYLIRSFFKHESVKLNRDIYVSLNTMRAFLSYDCPNNIGQLKSDVQLVCAKAYSEFLTNIKPDVRIDTSSIPQHIKEGLYKEKEHRILWNKLVSDEIEYFKFSSTSEIFTTPIADENSSIYEMIEQKLDKLKTKGISDIDIENILEKDIAKYFEKYISGVSDEINKKNLINILGRDVLDFIDKLVYSIVTSLKRNLNPNVYTALALHINTLITRVNSNKNIKNPQLEKIKELYPEEFKVALEAKALLEQYLNKSIPEDEAGYLTLFLVPEEQLAPKGVDKVKVILIAHGRNTATSMSEVANELLGEDYVIGINSPLEVSPSVVLEELRKVVKENFSTSGYVLLVDMGSLTTFGDVIEKEFKVPIKVFTLVSTLHVIEATRKALLGFSVDDIYKDLLQVNSYLETKKEIQNKVKSKPKLTIVTACLTGEGSSVAVKNFLKSNLKYDKDIFEIISLNCLDKNYFKQELIKLREEKEILFLVTSSKVDLDIKQYSIYDVISMKVLHELQQIIDNKTTLLKMPMVLKENIPNFDGVELFNDIRYIIERIESKLSVKLAEEDLIALILHFSFMLSRLKNNEKCVDFPNIEGYKAKNKEVYDIIKETLLFVYNKYLIEVPDNEICYLIKSFISLK